MSGEANDNSQAIGTASSASPSSSTAPLIDKDPDNIEVRLRLLQKNGLIPDIPYLCTVPSNREYKRAREEDSHWIVGDLFTPAEERLQYMSYLFRDPEDGLMIQVGDWAKKDQSKTSVIDTRSGTATPFNVKKKMTLSDYHNKPKAGTTGKAEPVIGANGLVNGITKDIPKSLGAVATRPHVEKRPADAMIERQPSHTSAKQESPQPAKKMRKSPPPSSVHQQLVTKPKSPEHTLPKSPKYTLPPLISPTLPPVIEAELLKYLDSTPLEGKEESQNKQSTPPKVNGAPPKREVAKKEPGRQERAIKTVKQDLDEGKSSLALSRVPSDRSSPSLASAASVSATTSKPERPEIRKKDRLIVKLKYGKRNKTTIQRLLNLSDSRASTKERQKRDVHHEKDFKVENAKKQHKDQKAGKESRKADTKENEDRKTKDSHKIAEKRPRTATEEVPQEPASKRQKVPAGLDIKKAKTPMTPSFKSPTLSNTGSAQKDHGSTPKKTIQNTTSASMRRVGSSDTHARTPQAPPGSVEKMKTNGISGGSSSAGHERKDGTGNTETDHWRDQQSKYSSIGRDLKRETDPILKGEKAAGEGIKRAAIAKALDAMNCFMLAFTAENKKFNGEPNPGWRTMLQYCNFVILHTRKTSPPLYGLAVQLTAVCREMLSAFDIDRLEKTHIPFDNPKHQEEFAKFKSEMVENMQEMKRLWGVGLSALSVDELHNNFPKTWEGRARGEKEKPGKVMPGKYAGPYHLPLSSCSTSLEAVRFAHSLLKEWCRNEKVEFESRIVLA